MTFTIGYWIIPLALTALFFYNAKKKAEYDSRGQFMFGGLFHILYFGIATIGALIAWLVYSFLR
jgi:hypothetical protein